MVENHQRRGRKMKRNNIRTEEVRQSVRKHRQATHDIQMKRFIRCQDRRQVGVNKPTTLDEFIKAYPPKLESGKTIQKNKPVCTKCKGQGVLTMYLHRDDGRCYQCQGTGSSATVNCTGSSQCKHCEAIRREAYKKGANYY